MNPQKNMHNHFLSGSVAARVTAAVVGVSLLLGSGGIALAASSWNPTLLVNTESFQTIDEGNGTSDIEIRFGQTLQEKLYYDRTNSRFVFTKGLYISGNTKVIGNLSGSTLNVDGTASIIGATTISGNVKAKANLSGATLNVDGTASIIGATTISGNVKAKANLSGATLNVDGTASIIGATTISGNVKAKANLSGATLNVDGNAGIYGALSASGAVTTKSNLTINSDNDTNNAVLTFGNQTAAQSLTFSHANQRFEFSKNLKVNGSISGSTLTVDGNTTFKNITYSFPNAQGAANTYLKNDGSGNLSWATTSVGVSSGAYLSFHPEYPNAAYFASGSTVVGTLTRDYDTTNKETFYRWTSSLGTIQDYWVAVRVKVPKNFSTWSTTPIQFRYRTHSTSTAVNVLKVRLLDTTGADVAISGGSGLASGTADTWTTASITNVTGGTYTPEGYITVLIKAASTSAGWSDFGFLNINWSSTTP